jgi:hypothetical protein
MSYSVYDSTNLNIQTRKLNNHFQRPSTSKTILAYRKQNDNINCFINPILHCNQEEMKKYEKLNIINLEKEYKRPTTVVNERKPINFSINQEIKRIDKDKVNKNTANYTKINNNNTYLEKIQERAASASINNHSTYSKYFNIVSKEYSHEFRLICHDKKEVNQNVKKIQFKNLSSDIFFNKQNNQINNSSIKNNNITAISDLNKIPEKSNKIHENIVFYNDDVAKNKSSEKFVFYNKPSKVFYPNSQSHTNWTEKSGFPSLVNHSNTKYNPINMLIANNCKTKEDLINECKLNNNFNANNLANKKKSLCEIIDLNRNGAPNWNKLFTEQFKQDKNCFNKSKNICNTFYDNYNSYRSICSQPFKK